MDIWVTGIGVVSPLGIGAKVTMDALTAGQRAFRPLSLFELRGCRSTLAAEVPDLAIDKVAPAGQAARWSRTDTMAVLAAKEALSQAGLNPMQNATELLLGGSTAGMFESETLLHRLNADPDAEVDRRALQTHPLSAPADRIHETVGPFRQVRTLCSACSSGAYAIAIGAHRLHAGQAQRVLAGGADSLCRLSYAGFNALAALDPQACRPFDLKRRGLNLGEGAAFLLLETATSARERGAKAIATLAGWAMSAEAHHITQPETDGETALRVMRTAIARAGVEPGEVDYINAHGTATPHNDVTEATAIQRCFGSSEAEPAVSSSKGQIGHTLSAAGAIEAAITAMSVARQQIPATAGLEDIDPQCALNHVTQTRHQPVRAALSNSFGFGGTDSALLFTAANNRTAPRPPQPPTIVITAGTTFSSAGLARIEDALTYTEDGTQAGPVDSRAVTLDAKRARRFDHAARLSVIVTNEALQHADLSVDQVAEREQLGLVTGSCWGSAQQTGQLLQRIFDRGPRFVPPAQFPSVLPSSLASHAAIYTQLKGPTMTLSDLGTSGPAALATAADLIIAGAANAVLATTIEEANEIAARVSSPLCADIPDRGRRAEGACCLVLESEPFAHARGRRALAQLTAWRAWRGDKGHEALAALPVPPRNSLVIMARDSDAQLLDEVQSPWSLVPRRSVASRAGDHEGAAGFALSAGVSAIYQGQCDLALVLTLAPDRGYATLFAPIGSQPA